MMFHPDHSAFQTLSILPSVKHETNHALFVPCFTTCLHQYTILPSIPHNYVGPTEKRSGLIITSRLKKVSWSNTFLQPQVLPFPPLHAAPWELGNWEVLFLLNGRKDNFTELDIQQQFLQLANRFSDFQFIFTDGSKNGNRAGNAVFYSTDYPAIQHRFPDGTSCLCIADLHAVLKALERAAQHPWQKIMLCIDSRSVMQSVSHKIHSSSLLVDIYNILHHVASNGRLVHFLWIPEHNGI